MGSRWPLAVALLGAAVAADWCARLNPCQNGGTCSVVDSAWVCRCPGRWRGKRCQTGPESAAWADSSRPMMPMSSWAKPSPGSGSSVLTSRAANQPAGWHLSRAASHGEEMATASLAAKRAAGAGRAETAESLSPLGNRGQLHPSPTAGATFLLLSVVPPLLSLSMAPVGTLAHGPSPTSPSPSQGLGTRGQAATPPALGPRSRAMQTAAAAGNEASRTATAPLWLSPSGSPRPQEEGAGTSPHTAQGTSLAAVGQLVTGAAQPSSAGSTDSAKTPGAEPAPTQSVRPEELPWQPGGSEADGELGGKAGLHTAPPTSPTKPWPAVGLFPPGTVPPQPLAPPSPSAGPDLTGVEGSTPGRFVGSVGPSAPHKMPLGQRTMEWGWQGPAPPPSAGVPSRPEAPLRSTPAATWAPSPGSLPSGTGHGLGASHWVPRPSLLALGPGGLPTSTTGETGASGPGQEASPALQTPTAPLPTAGPEPTRPPGPPKFFTTHTFAEPFSPLPGPAQSSPAATQHPPLWIAKGGNSANAASSTRGNFVGHTDPVALPADSRQRPPTATPEERVLLQAASQRADGPAGEATGTTGPPSSRIPGKGMPTTLGPPGTTEPQTSSTLATKGDSTRSGLFSSSRPSAAAEPTAQEGDTVAFHQLPVTRQWWPPPARTWRWRGGSQSQGPTGIPGREASPPVHGPGPLPTAATLAGSPWHSWPAPGPGRGAWSDPPLASTWLVAVVPEATTPLVPATPREAHARIQHVFVVENQPPRLKAAFLNLSWELTLAMEFASSFGDPQSPESQALVLSINATVAPLFASVPGFQRLEVRSIRPGGVAVLFDALFRAEAPGLWAALKPAGLSKQLPPGLWVANSTIPWRMTLERPLDPCTEVFACPTGYECVLGEDGNATCASVCHRQYCKNQGICTHAANQTPVCQCPVGGDFWFLGVRCDYKVTHQALLGVSCGLLLSLVLIGAAVSALVVRRVRTLLLEARADQTKSSYRRFCRLDDVSAHYWSEPWLASVNSLDNPAFSTSEELLHLQILEPPRGSCPDVCLATEGHCKPRQGPTARQTAGRPRSLCSWEQSSGSGNEHMIDSGKASEVSVSSWPTEPIRWSPSPARHELSGKPTHKGRSPHSYCKGMELINLERSWTA